MKGSYTILIELSERKKVEVGSLGVVEFSPGFYAYNGSAFGPGGLKRVERHGEKSREAGSPHWHVDYLLVLDESEIVEVFKSGSDHECELSREMKEDFSSVDGFGCSDCSCSSHLFSGDELKGFLSDFYSGGKALT